MSSNYNAKYIMWNPDFILKNDSPIYVLCLFGIVFVALFYIIITWVFGHYFSTKHAVEGFENPQYTYLPSKSLPNLSVKFGLSDLAVDISSACGFIKTDSKLNMVVNVDSVNSSPSPAPSSTTTPVPYSTTKSEPYSTSEERNNTSEPVSTTESTSETQPPLPTSAVKLNLNGEYTVSYTQLKIYNMYNTATGYNITSNDNIYKIMDGLYGRFFDVKELEKWTDENVKSLWNETDSIIIDDAIYNGSNFFVIQSGLSNRKCASSEKDSTGLSSYFLKQILKNKSSSGVLLSMKNAYYAIVKPRFLLNTLSNVYWQNVKTLTNGDKGTQDSILFVLNTFADLAATNKLKVDLAAEGVAKIISEDTPFTMDSLWLYQMMGVAFELYRYVAYFKEHGSDTTSSGNPAITTNIDKFISGYPLYLQKTNQVAPESPLVFLLKNLPNKSECQIVDKLTPYFRNLNG